MLGICLEFAWGLVNQCLGTSYLCLHLFWIVFCLGMGFNSLSVVRDYMHRVVCQSASLWVDLCQSVLNARAQTMPSRPHNFNAFPSTVEPNKDHICALQQQHQSKARHKTPFHVTTLAAKKKHKKQSHKPPTHCIVLFQGHNM